MERENTQSELKNQQVIVSNLASLQLKPRKIKKDNRIKADFSKTQYPLLRNVAATEIGWKIWTRQESKDQINLYWVDTYVSDEKVRKLKSYQRINHFPGSYELGKKNFLCSNLNRLRKSLPKQYNFYPSTWNIPADIQQYEKFASTNEDKYYIVKPCGDSQGRGIYITKSFDICQKQQLVLQEYIDNPLLVENMKFDLRIYVVLKSLFPLKIYIYNEGLSRLATSQYKKPDSQNVKNVRMHLTNYAINKLSPNYIFNKNLNEDNVGHKRSYTAIMNILGDLGCNVKQIQVQIDQIIVKTILAAYPRLIQNYKNLRESKDQTDSVCFQILGFDIMISENYKPYLIEVNHSPSFCTQTPLDLVIKRYLILDTFSLLNLNHEDKINYFKNRNQTQLLYVHSNANLRNDKFGNKNVIKESEAEDIGAFRKIYPLQNTRQLEQINKCYETVFKHLMSKKTSKVYRKAVMMAPVLQTQSEEEQILIQAPHKKIGKNQYSFSLYNVINNLKINKFNSPRFLIKHDISQMHSPAQNQVKLDSEIDYEFVKKQEIMLYQRIRKDKERERNKFILPMHVNNVSIKFDQNNIHKLQRGSKSVETRSYYYPSCMQNTFKIHSFLNAGVFHVQRERKRIKQKGNHTNYQTYMDENPEGVLTTASNSTNNNNTKQRSYSSQLRQKIERMQLARVKIQGIKKVDKGGSFILIRSKAIQKRQFDMTRNQTKKQE